MPPSQLVRTETFVYAVLVDPMFCAARMGSMQRESGGWDPNATNGWRDPTNPDPTPPRSHPPRSHPPRSHPLGSAGRMGVDPRGHAHIWSCLIVLSPHSLLTLNKWLQSEGPCGSATPAGSVCQPSRIRVSAQQDPCVSQAGSVCEPSRIRV